MITEIVNINGIEYMVSSSTYRGLVEAKETLRASIASFEKKHPSQPLPGTPVKEPVKPQAKKSRPKKTK